ncbi:MAG: hypothetical protein Q7S87_01055 [Agitococcus sp.]|nr:hypothetical protein [Agitococcus sp.]
MKKWSLILLCLCMAAMGSACSKKTADAAADIPAATASAPVEIAAPKPAAPGTGSAAPELSAEQIKKIQAEIEARSSTTTSVKK